LRRSSEPVKRPSIVAASSAEAPAAPAAATEPVADAVEKTAAAHSRAPSGMSRQSSLTLEAEDAFEPTVLPKLTPPAVVPPLAAAVSLPPLPPRRQPAPLPQLAAVQARDGTSGMPRRSSRLGMIAEAAGKAQTQLYGQLRNIVRARVDTIDAPLSDPIESPQGSFRLRADSNRPRSTRLSDADVGFMLSRVGKISGESLRKAAIENNAALTEALVRGAVFVDDVDARGRSALMWAAKEGSMDAAIHLVELDASLELKDEQGLTALAHAVEQGRWTTFRALADCGADMGTVDNGGRSLLTRALARLERLSEPQPGVDGRKVFVQTAEICRALVASTRGSAHSREGLKPATVFLLDEWFRAKQAAEPLVVPAFSDMLGGEQALAAFFASQRRRVNALAAAKIFVVLGFVAFDLVMRQEFMAFTPLRVALYAGLYLGAYYL